MLTRVYRSDGVTESLLRLGLVTEYDKGGLLSSALINLYMNDLSEQLRGGTCGYCLS